MSNVTSILDQLSDDERSVIEAAIAANKRAPRSLTVKVSKKGAACVYGLQRFPVTLYRQQWTRLLDFADDIRTFLASEPSAMHDIDGTMTEVTLAVKD